MSGPLFKMAVLVLMIRIYMEEDIPKAMRTASLMKIYKRKGSLEDLKSFQFIHWAGKLFERCVMSIIEDAINTNTSEHSF